MILGTSGSCKCGTNAPCSGNSNICINLLNDLHFKALEEYANVDQMMLAQELAILVKTQKIKYILGDNGTCKCAA